MKAGGPNYVAQFIHFDNVPYPEPAEPIDHTTLATLCADLQARAAELGPDGPDIVNRITTAVASCVRAFRDEFSREHDHFKLVGQDNFRRYRPLRYVRIRLHAEDSPFDLFVRVCAAHAAGCHVTVSVPRDFSSIPLKLLEQLTESWAGAIEFLEESNERLAEILRDHQTDRVRYAAPARAPTEILEAAAESNIAVISRPVSDEGRLEMLWYLYEQSISIDYHRYGNLGARASEPRAPVL